MKKSGKTYPMPSNQLTALQKQKIAAKRKKKAEEKGPPVNVKKNPKNLPKNTSKNVSKVFALPEDSLSIDNYYKQFNLDNKDGMYLDPKNSNNEILMGLSIFCDPDNDNSDGAKQSKVLPAVYEDLLNAARGRKNRLSFALLTKEPFNTEILPQLKKKITNVKDAGKKFEAFNYIQLIEEYLLSDEPIAIGATLGLENSANKKFRRMMVQAIEPLPGESNDGEKGSKKGVHVLLIYVPFEKNSYIEEKINPMSFVYLITEKDMAKNDSSNNYKVRIVRVFPQKNREPTILMALMSDEEMKELSKVMRQTFAIFVLPNIVSANAIMHSIRTVNRDTDVAAKVFPPYKANKNAIELYKHQMASNLNSLFNDSTKSFNQKQKEAVYAMTRPVNTTFLLFGPPGTGKTYTLVETIRQLLDPKNGKKALKNTILICAPSNMAADAIAEGILDRRFLKSYEIFRLVSASRDAVNRNQKLDSITQRRTLKDINNEAICPVYDLPNYEKLKEFKVIICTLGSTPSLSNSLDAGHFSHIFVDEAAQAPEMDVWLAVSFFAQKDTRLILAGDPKQLGPVTPSNLLSDDNVDYKKSLLARLVEQKTFNEDPRYLIQLTDNHRSHEGIVKISSQLFYNNSLKATKPAGHDSLCKIPFLQKPNFPVIFHSVPNGFEELSEMGSKKNKAEIEVVVHYVNQCLKYVKPKDIGVVAPYKYQAECIRHRLNNSQITVETVEKFQGSERRVIIMSTVRTKDLGFMACNLRLNTSITRAKHLLVVVGNTKCLSKKKSWKRFIDYCDQNNSLIKPGNFSNLRNVNETLAKLRKGPESLESSFAKLRIRMNKM